MNSWKRTIVATAIGTGAVLSIGGLPAAASAAPVAASAQTAHGTRTYLGPVYTPSKFTVNVGAGKYVVAYDYDGVADFTTSVDGVYLGVTPAPYGGGEVTSKSFTLKRGQHSIVASFPDGYGDATAYLVRS